MVEQIPPDFEKHWEGANVILHTQNSKEKNLYANKEELAENSSYFNAMFFSGFKEANQDSVIVPCSYRCMLSILKTIHKSNNGCLLGASTVQDLVEMYRIADMFDLPNITNIPIEKIDAKIMTIAMAAMELGNHDMLVNCLERMDKHSLRSFIGKNDGAPLFCKKDAVLIFEKIRGISLPKDPYILEAIAFPKLAKSIQETNVMKKTISSDLAISTRNSNGSPLYTKNEILATSSNNFRQMFKINKSSSISLDVDYITMKTILCVLHKLTFSSSSKFHPLLLFDMYRFAKDFNMPIIKNFVSDRLAKQATAGCLEVALILKLAHWKTRLMAEMLPSEMCNWVLSGDEELIYNDGNGENVAVSSKATDLNLSLNDLRSIFLKIQSEFVKSGPNVARGKRNRKKGGSSGATHEVAGGARKTSGASRGGHKTTRGGRTRAPVLANRGRRLVLLEGLGMNQILPVPPNRRSLYPLL